MAILKRFLRVFRFLFLLALALAVGAVLVFTLTERGRDNLAGLISTMASSDDAKVRIGGIDGIWSGALSVDHVVLEDAEGPWLAVRGVRIDWSPLALLSSTFRADRVHADRIEVARLPKPGEAKEQSSSGSGLPVAVDIKAIDLPHIALGPDIAGGIAEVSARGSLAAQTGPTDIRADLAIARSDGAAGTLDAKIGFAPAENRLDLDIHGAEPAGGVIANLLKLPGTPPVEIAASGSGPVADWKGKATLTIDGAVATTLSGTHQSTETGSRVTLAGDGDFERLVPQALSPLLAGAARFDVAGALGNDGGIAVEKAQLSSAAVEASASGSIDPKGVSDFTLKAQAAGEPVRLALGEGDAAIELTFDDMTARAFGAGDAPMIDARVSLPRVATRGYEARDVEAALHSDGFDIASRSGPATLDLKAGSVTTDNATLAPLLAGVVSARAETTVSDQSIRIDKGSVTTGAVSVALSGVISLVDPGFSVAVRADLAASALPEAARGVLDERVKASASIERDADGALSVKSLNLASGALTVEGDAALGGETIEATLSGALADVGRLAEGASGAIRFDVKAGGKISAPDVTLNVASERIEAAGRRISGLQLTASGTADLARPAATVTLKGDVAGAALDGSAVLKTVEGRREIKGLSLTLGPNRIAGDLVLDEAFVPEGSLTFSIPDVGPLAALAFETAKGDIEGNVRFARKDGVPELTVDARSAALSRGDAAAKGVVVAATVNDYMGAPAVSGTVKAASVVSGKTTIDKIDISLTRDGAWTGFSGGATVAGIPAMAAGRVKLEGGVTTVELASGKATVSGVAASVAKSSTVVVRNGQASLDKFALNVAGGSVVMSGTAGEALALDVQLASLPATIANTFSPGLNAAGTISGTARISGPAAKPQINYAIDWKGAQTAQTRNAGFGAMTIASSGTFAGGVLKFDAAIGDAAGLGLKGGGTVSTAGIPTLSLDFSGKVPFGFLTQRLAAQGLSLSGGADVSLQVRGPALSPSIGGAIRTTSARLIDSRSGIAIDDISADVALGSGVATIRSLKGSLSTGGSISATGTVGIDAAKGFPADLSVKIASGRYTDGRVVTTTLDGDLALKGSLVGSPVLSGRVDLAKTVITVPEKLPASLATLDVRHKNASSAVVRQQEAIQPAQAQGGGGGLTLDLTVNAPQQIFVRGRGLDAELGGSLKLAGPSGAPQATGQSTLRRGRLSILGKRLDFTSGTLGFSGALIPYLDLTAQSSANDATVTVVVSGPATNPKFAFSSIPTLPEDEVLARLIFGRSMSNLSPLQIAQLAQAAAQLAGVGGSTSLLDTLRDSTGIDDLDVRTDSEGNASVAAGKYLNDRTYVTIEKGEKAGSGKATIDLNIGRGVKLRGEAGEEGRAKGGIFFEREY
jgi:translocation and assembly module TamB